MLTSIINQAQDDNNFINPIKLDVFTVLEIVSGYAGVTFTEKQKENPAKLYDALKSSGFYKAVVNSIPKSEYKEFLNSLVCLVEKIYNYRTSVLGILDTISADYSNLNLDATDIQKKLADPENMALLKSVLTKLG